MTSAQAMPVHTGWLGRFEYKYVVLSVTTIGILMAAIDSSIVVLALPDMMIKLKADLIEMTWVVMAYTLASTTLLLTFGRVADMFGRVRIYNLGFVVFTLGSLMCGLSQNALQLIIFRVIQGGGAAMMFVNSTAIITEVFPPHERGRALGINVNAWAIGSIASPIIGGLILAATDWRWIFLVNLPIGVFGALWAYRVLREVSMPSKGQQFDSIGAVLFSLGLTALLIGGSFGAQFGWMSVEIVSLFTLSLAMLGTFVWWERRTTYPMLSLSLFSSRIYTLSALASTLLILGAFAVNFLIAFYLQAVRGFDPLTAALLLAPLPIVSSIVAPLSGALADRIGSRIPATLGPLLQGAALLWLTRLTPTTPYYELAAGLALMGLGGGLFWPPNTRAAMNAAPGDRLGVASGTLATLRQAGMTTSYALALAVAAGSLPRDVMMRLFVGTDVALGSQPMQAFVGGMHSAFFVSVVLCLAAALTSVGQS